MRLRTWLFASTLVGCGSAPVALTTQPSPTVAQVDVTPPPATVETKFRGDVEVDVTVASFSSIEDAKHLDEVGRAATKLLVPCLKHEAPKPLDVWIVGRVDEQGHLEGAKVAADVSPALTPCLVASLSNVAFKGTLPLAASLLLHAEPAPSECKGDECVFIHPPPKDHSAEHADTDEADAAGGPQGNILGSDIGDSFGAGGLGLSGIGPGGGGTGEGIGLGSIGTIGHGAGLGRGQGFGTGLGRLEGEHKNLRPSLRMGAVTVSGRLPPEVIQRIVRQNFGRFRLCYENGLRKDPKLEGSVNTTFEIGGNGEVTKVTDAKSGLPNKDVVQCVQKGFAGLSFPQPEGGIVKVTFPISFKPGAPASPPPVFTVGGVHFPALTPDVVVRKLASGWRTMVVAGPPAEVGFAVFAMKASASRGPVTSALWNRGSAMPFLEHKSSEGFHLTFDGVDAVALEGDLVDPASAAP